jgi:hypothetical protein
VSEETVVLTAFKEGGRMTYLGTTALALGLLTGAPESAPTRPQARVEAPKKQEKELTGRMILGIPYGGARFKIQGDVEKKIPFRLHVPLGNFIELQIRGINDVEPYENFIRY